MTHLTFVWGSINSGGFTCLKDLVRGQAAIGMDVEILALVYSKNDATLRELMEWEGLGIKVVTVDVSENGQRDDLNVVRVLMAYMGERTHRIIHHSDGKYVGILAARLAGNRKTVVTYHHTLPRASTPYAIHLKRLIDPLVSRYIAVSESVNAYLTGPVHIARAKVDKIHNGLDFSKPLLDRTTLRTRYGIGLDEFVVGFVGRLEAEKNIPILLHAAKQLRHLVFVIIGDGAQRQALEGLKASEKLANVRFLGQQPAAPEMTLLFDLFCLPSRSEACPMTILEALRAGLPVLANDVGEISQMLQNGKYGVCRSLDHGDVLKAQILEIYENYPKYKKMANSAFAAVKQRYAPEQVVQDTVDVYKRVGAEEGRAGLTDRAARSQVFRVLRHVQKAALMGRRHRFIPLVMAMVQYVLGQARLLQWQYFHTHGDG